jgi:hypothetical protein
VKSVAYAVMRVADPADQENLQLAFTSVLPGHLLEDELNDSNPYITTLTGGILIPGESRIARELKPVSRNPILHYIILICDFLGLLAFLVN